MQKTWLPLFSVAYWRQAAAEFRSLRSLVLAALFIALRIAVGMLYIPVGDNLRMLFKFIPDAVGSLILGPLLGMLVGGAADVLGAFLFPTGPFFPGYTLSAILTYLVFALFFYLREVDVVSVILARLSTNVFINIGLGSLWSHMLMGKGYLYYLAKSVVKNLVLLPVEVIIILLIFRALMPALSQSKMIPRQRHIPFFRSPKQRRTI